MKYLHKELSYRIAFQKTSKFARLVQHPIKMVWPSIVHYIGSRLGIIRPQKILTFFGETMKVVLPEVVSSSLYRYGFFEEGLTTFILNYVKPGMTFFDIGPHYGYFTLLAAHLVGPDGIVHAFEPTPSTFQLLLENTSKSSKIIVHNTAVWSEKTILEFNDYGIMFSAFNSAYKPRVDKQYRKDLTPQIHQVSATSIDAYVHETHCIPDFIKIDAESAEYNILLGMSELFQKHKPYIALEVGDLDVEGAIKSKQIVRFLTDRGYEAFEYKDGKIVRHDIQDKYDCNNIFFIHPDMLR